MKEAQIPSSEFYGKKSGHIEVQNLPKVTNLGKEEPGFKSQLLSAKSCAEPINANEKDACSLFHCIIWQVHPSAVS